MLTRLAKILYIIWVQVLYYTSRELIKTNSGHILTTAQIEKISSYRKKLGEGLAGNTISKI